MTGQRIRNVRVREDDLRSAVGALHDWYSTLEDAARGDGYGEPDPGTLAMAKDGMRRAIRLAKACDEAFGPRPTRPEGGRMVSIQELRRMHEEKP